MTDSILLPVDEDADIQLVQYNVFSHHCLQGIMSDLLLLLRIHYMYRRKPPDGRRWCAIHLHLHLHVHVDNFLNNKLKEG